MLTRLFGGGGNRRDDNNYSNHSNSIKDNNPTPKRGQWGQRDAPNNYDTYDNEPEPGYGNRYGGEKNINFHPNRSPLQGSDDGDFDNVDEGYYNHPDQYNNTPQHPKERRNQYGRNGTGS